MYLKIALYVGLFLGGLAIGWGTAANKYKLEKSESENKTLQEQNERANQNIAIINERLVETAERANEARDRTQDTLNRLGDLERTHNIYVDRVSAQTLELSNEISKLGIPTCVFGANYGGMWERIGERANTGRSSLYQTGPDPSN